MVRAAVFFAKNCSVLIRESEKYNEIIGSLEEEKQNLEKLLEEEQSKLNQFSVYFL